MEEGNHVKTKSEDKTEKPEFRQRRFEASNKAQYVDQIDCEKEKLKNYSWYLNNYKKRASATAFTRRINKLAAIFLLGKSLHLLARIYLQL